MLRSGEFMRKTVRTRKSEDAGIASIGEIFKGLGNFIELVSELEETGKETMERTGEIALPSGKVMYGFSVKIGGVGAPQVERFGNIVRETEKGPVVEEIREPFVDIFEETDTLEVIAELPGIEEKDISCKIKGDVLLLNAKGEDRKYSKEVLLPTRASMQKTEYKNGVLRLILKKENK